MKRILTIVVTCTLALVAMAQPRLKEREYYLGVHGGVSASTVLFSPKVDYMTPLTKTALLGGNGGLVFRYTGHKCCGLQVELNYLQRGWREVNTGEGVNYTRKLHYVEIPFMSHIYFGSPKVRGYVNIGPQVGYCIADRESGTRNTQLQYPVQYEKIQHPVDWGIVGGVGVYFRTQKAGVYQVEVRFDYSLGDIFATRVEDHFSLANPMDLSINLAWMMEVRSKKKK